VPSSFLLLFKDSIGEDHLLKRLGKNLTYLSPDDITGFLGAARKRGRGLQRRNLMRLKQPQLHFFGFRETYRIVVGETGIAIMLRSIWSGG
jgi:hypothetical protein